MLNYAHPSTRTTSFNSAIIVVLRFFVNLASLVSFAALALQAHEPSTLFPGGAFVLPSLRCLSHFNPHHSSPPSARILDGAINDVYHANFDVPLLCYSAGTVMKGMD
jgi:hypothetical protein